MQMKEKESDSKIIRGPDLLKILPPSSKAFDIDSSSGSFSSEYSGPFSSVVYDEKVEIKRKHKKLFGKDLYSAFCFSTEFKSVMEDLKVQMKRTYHDKPTIEHPVMEDFEEKKFNCIGSFTFEEIIKNESQSLSFPDTENNAEDSLTNEADGKRNENKKYKKKIGGKSWDSDESIFETMSGYWRLLSVYDTFKISSPWYNAYEEGNEHWLQTKPIPSEVLENSRQKCLDWLKKYFYK